MSTQRLSGLTNPLVAGESSFRGSFWVGNVSLFLYCLWVHRGCVGWRIHFLNCESSFGGSLWVGRTQLSLTVYESTGAVWADESIRHLWKQFRRLFLSGQRLSFPWLFMSRQGQCGLTNPFVTSERSFGGYFLVGSDSVFLDCLWVDRVSVGWRIHLSPMKAVSGAIS